MSHSSDRSGASHARHSFRSRHRAASHVSAHADAEHQKAHKIVDHPLVPQGPAQVITDQSALAQLLDHLREMRSFAYDSEFIGELSYDPRLCLLQVATTAQVALIDPMAPIDLTPFWEILADQRIEKIVHAGEQDIEPVARLIQRPCANLFDTQIAAGFIALAYPVSLSKLVGQITGAKLGKGLTFTHWDQRPLSAVQLRYAADDVRYLPAVRAAIGAKLDELGHTAWAAEECAGLCDPKRYSFDPDADFLRLRGAGTLSATGLAVVRELMIWRESMARSADVPPRAYLRDEILIDIARHPPKELDRLERIRGLPRPVEQEHGSTILRLVQQGLSRPLKGLPPQPREPTPAERFRGDSLWALLQCLCLGRGIDANLVASRQDVTELDRLLASDSDIAQHRLMRGWRGEAVGTKMLKLIRENTALTVGWSGGSMRVE
jgi:ribonuclease D